MASYPISIHALLAESDSFNPLRCAPPKNFYPRSPCGERPLRYSEQSAPPYISIHALLAESDLEGRVSAVEGFLFLSTLSLRRATAKSGTTRSAAPNFYPRSPCGERRKAPRTGAERKTISIHALLAESDEQKDPRRDPQAISIHALLAESDVMQGKPQQTAPGISIHALLAESDYFCPP